MKQIPEIKDGQSLELLKELHILTRDGQLNQDSRRKLKQVYHLYQFIEPLLSSCKTVVDHGAGKSYLGFIIYDLFFKSKDEGQIFGIEVRPELVKKSIELASRLKFNRMSFHHLSVQDSMTSESLPETIDMVTALHACDTATDDAIDFALSKKAKYIVMVPCCQAEVATHLRQKKNESFGKTPLSELWRHPIHTREFGSNLTNALRSLKLEAQGYQVTVTELLGWEHSLKNELIIAEYKGQPRKNANDRINEILNQLNLTDLKARFIKENL